MSKQAEDPAPRLSLKLPPHQFAEFVNTLRGKTPDASIEKRRTTRITLSAKILLFKLDSTSPDQGIEVIARDLSIEGIGILSAVPFKLQDTVIINLPRTPTLYSRLICQVAYVGQMAQGLYSLGCRFIGELPSTK